MADQLAQKMAGEAASTIAAAATQSVGSMVSTGAAPSTAVAAFAQTMATMATMASGASGALAQSAASAAAGAASAAAGASSAAAGAASMGEALRSAGAGMITGAFNQWRIAATRDLQNPTGFARTQMGRLRRSASEGVATSRQTATVQEITSHIVDLSDCASRAAQSAMSSGSSDSIHKTLSDVVNALKETAVEMKQFADFTKDQTLEGVQGLLDTFTGNHNSVMSGIESLKATEVANKDAIVQNIQQATSAVGAETEKVVQAVTQATSAVTQAAADAATGADIMVQAVTQAGADAATGADIIVQAVKDNSVIHFISSHKLALGFVTVAAIGVWWFRTGKVPVCQQTPACPKWVEQVSVPDLNAVKKEIFKETTASILKLQKKLQNEQASSFEKLTELISANSQATNNLTYLVMGLYAIIAVVVVIGATMFIAKQLKGRKPKTPLLKTSNDF